MLQRTLQHPKIRLCRDQMMNHDIINIFFNYEWGKHLRNYCASIEIEDKAFKNLIMKIFCTRRHQRNGVSLFGIVKGNDHKQFLYFFR